MKGKYVTIGIANIDIYTGKTNIFQFKETYANNPTTYDELERFISIYNPSETIIISNLQAENEIDYVVSYAGISSSLIHKINITDEKSIKMTRVKNCEKQPYQKEIFQDFINLITMMYLFKIFMKIILQHKPFAFYSILFFNIILIL